MTILTHILKPLLPSRKLWSVLLSMAVCTSISAQIVIGGDVYGGGRQGEVGTSNQIKPDSVLMVQADSVKLKDGAAKDTATTITINAGTMRTIFGGGENGRTYGSTVVIINGSSDSTKLETFTQIGGKLNELDWNGTTRGGIFGAGDGSSAYVFGNTKVTILGGFLPQNVYGGGNQADLMGTASVTLLGGDIQGTVYGGSRLADIYGYSYVNIDGQHIQNDLLIGAVYGGNDIAGNITNLPSNDPRWTWLKGIQQPAGIANDYNHFNTFVRSTQETSGKHIYVGQIFGGGNGDYTYTPNNTKLDVDTLVDMSSDGTKTPHVFTVSTQPEVENAYLDLNGGAFGYVFGGGNRATVTKETVIGLNNNTTNFRALSKDLLHKMGINFDIDTTAYTFSNDSVVPRYQFDRVFGGNNKAEMKIQPTWKLQKANIHNLYSGGNEGLMSNPNGLLLALTSADLSVTNVYGGSRKADVKPMLNGAQILPLQKDTVINMISYTFPAGHSARTLITAGNIVNVYGGNDIKGNVEGGNAIIIESSIIGDVYGGGNGSYFYTDKENLIKASDANMLKYGDFYYDPDDVLAQAGVSVSDKMKSVTALGLLRPNAERVYISVSGTETDTTVIGGSLYCGGNSATITAAPGQVAEDKIKLNIGSYVIADKVFLGNNGENMIATSMLQEYKDHSTVDLTDSEVFAKYIGGVSMNMKPKVTFVDGLVDYSTYIGSLYCGGNIGSMTYSGRNEQNFNDRIIVYNKVVGGSNNANIPATALNAAFEGGILGADNEENYDSARIVLNFKGLRLEPLRLTESGKLEWNTKKWQSYTDKPAELVAVDNDPDAEADDDLRLDGATVFGGCYSSGHVNGNVVINVLENLVDTSRIFNDCGGSSGVYFDNQAEDVMMSSLYVYGAGYGAETEIWGSTTINLKKGFIFQALGGGEKGAVGRKNAQGKYEYNPKYSTYINLNGTVAGMSDEHTHQDLAEVQYLYGGGNQGVVAGNTHVYLGNGRIYDAFGGACNADILGHAELYIGRALVSSANPKYESELRHDTTSTNVFPWVRDNIYGGNDFGGTIKGVGYFGSNVREEARSMIYDYDGENTLVLKAQSYIEFYHGRVDSIYGGSYGSYDYTDPIYYQYNYVEGGDQTNQNNLGTFRNGYSRPYLENAFVYLRPAADANSSKDAIKYVFGASMGYPGYSNPGEIEKDLMQQRSYVLVDIPQTLNNFSNTQIFGSGAYSGLGMNKYVAPADNSSDSVSAVVDLIRGNIGNAYGGGYSEGITRRTVVNIPSGSTIKVNNVFGGGYGDTLLVPCDVYESNVNYLSDVASVGKIYGGNNHSRRTLYATVNVGAQMWTNRNTGWLGTVFGAGLGKDTWSNYTSVNLNDGSLMYEAYGGGEAGRVLNKASVDAWAATNHNLYTDLSYYTTNRVDGNLDNALVHENGLGDTTNTNVYINNGATVGYRHVNIDTIGRTTEYIKIDGGYCYAGGLGAAAVVSGTTYIGLHGGLVWKDIYAGGTSGGVRDEYKLKTFTAQTNAYIEGGRVRNVYGGGWEGHVGYTQLPFVIEPSQIATEVAKLVNDIPGRTNVVIGISEDKAGSIQGYGLNKGVPSIERNVYAGGEGGAVFGTASLTMHNGYVGYRYFESVEDDTTTVIDEHYAELINDDTWFIAGDRDHALDSLNRLKDSGNAFGGGYVDNSSVDTTIVNIYGGHIRNSVYGGGEVAIIGRGEAHEVVVDNKRVRQLKGVYKSGLTNVNIYSGNIHQNVFGGGKGFNNTGDQGSKYTNGYVFGQTRVNILGGEIGTLETVAQGDGNVFGGGNIGYVYNPLQSKKNDKDGYYYQIDSNGNYIKVGNDSLLSEDCRVIVTPYAKVLANEIQLTDTAGNSKTFSKGEYVPTDYLMPLRKSDARWNSLDQTGIIIRNALFAGGNVSTGNTLYANTKTVFGNATATLNDLYHTDLITLGTEHIGGLYGDGNLTRVDGYRELNITNYGTDYYNLDEQIDIETYHSMKDRERAYFQLEYVLVNEIPGFSNYSVGTRMTLDELRADFSTGTGDNITYRCPPMDSIGMPDTTYWKEYGFASVYAGRLINTIQRADFVGVFGSRMVLQGARDRVPEVVNYTDYSINRVGEISLNRMHSPSNDTITGNYFGIYNIANYLGAMTSDVDFYDSVRVTSPEHMAKAKYYPHMKGETYYQWKDSLKDQRSRNDGTSKNKVALASGVYLELNKETTANEEKQWGEVTGVLELDLINVMPGLGGGYVYAKNVHGERKPSGKKQVTLSAYNTNAISNKQFVYDSKGGAADSVFQTSGNFVNSIKEIIDDCYPNNGSYTGIGAAPAHYWYIKGQIYVYDQYISAYTGAADSYDKTVNIPLTITAGSNGKLQLIDVKTNKYAYWKNYGAVKEPLKPDEKIIVNNKSYYLNDTISYWDWSMLTADEQNKFVDTTYVAMADCKATSSDSTIYSKGTVMLPAKYDSLLQTSPRVIQLSTGVDTLLTALIRPSNNMSHNNGFALTFELTNPQVLDAYYTPISGTGVKLNATEFDKQIKNGAINSDDYYSAPTYKATATGVFGQRQFDRGDIITARTYDGFKTIEKLKGNIVYDDSKDAKFDTAFVLTQKLELPQEGSSSVVIWNEGLVISKHDFDSLKSKSLIDITKADTALFCIDTWKLERDGFDDEYVNYSTCLTKNQIYELGRTYAYSDNYIDSIIGRHFSPAYYCVKEGKYGGSYYEYGKNYTTLNAWSSMNPEDRHNFQFNYDAFDIMIDPAYSKHLGLYDTIEGHISNNPIYSVEQPIDYEARYHGKSELSFTKPNNGGTFTIHVNDTLQSSVYEAIPNEQGNYAPFQWESSKDTIFYIVNHSFTKGEITYSAGNSITRQVYMNLDNHMADVDVIESSILPGVGKYYYCRNDYSIGSRGTVLGKDGQVTDVRPTAGNYTNQGTITEGWVHAGAIISEDNYDDHLPNLQANFTIHGQTPVETSTLYVSGQSDIQSLSKGRIFTIIYQYSYEESDGLGKNIELITERHIVNIYVQFKSGTPTIAQLSELETVLPGATMGLNTPQVTPGAYEVVGGGWEMFANQQDAENHVNGSEFENTRTKLYWYEDGYYLAYYAKTYLGKTYSNAVPIKVGNYHDLDKVMADTVYHMYVDHPNVKRNSKIYIDNRNCLSDTAKNELDLFKDFFDMTLNNLEGHQPISNRVKGAENIDFILRADMSPKYYTTWTPIGTTDQCFEGTLHGDGHSINGLTSSLFGYLCGDVFNLGVTGSFGGNSSGIADHGDGYAENTWIYTTGSVTPGTKAVMGSGTVKNSYYPVENTGYIAPTGVTARPLTAFRNGEVAYDLNGFYLRKRYNDNNGVNTGKEYKYYTLRDNASIENTLSAPISAYNATDDAPYIYKTSYGDRYLGYVENRYIDGDFIYAGGKIASSVNERLYTAKDETDAADNGLFFPIWPDDYIYFGQMLTYGYSSEKGQTYQEFPTAVNKGDRSSTSTAHEASSWLVKEDGGQSNRVYRTPAYFGNSETKSAYFNANAYLPALTQDGTKDVYRGLTAVDFTARGDSWTNDDIFSKILDFDSNLTGIHTNGQTRNLLVYAPVARFATLSVLSDYFTEPDYEISDTYGSVSEVASNVVSGMHGHLVEYRKDNNVDLYEAAFSQFLVDGNDFNAPISYTTGSNFMWYQRKPGAYVELADSGWESISLPFTATYVTTSQKGEITHFYEGSDKGHEYWLRSPKELESQTMKFQAIRKQSGNDHDYSNRFLWNYYYSKHNHSDAHGDTYQTYYNNDITYNDYPYALKANPYLIGFPGSRYYEFDMSGKFVPEHTGATIYKLDAQAITFRSDNNETIGVSDQDYESVVTVDGYTYRPTYQAKSVGADTTLLLNSKGSRFVVAARDTVTVPFRAYMTKSNSGSGQAQTRSAAGTRASSLYIGYAGDVIPLEDVVIDHGLNIYGQNLSICIESTLEQPATITITSVAGKLLKTFTIQPGTKVTVPVNNRGVYIVNRHKIAVTK